LIRRTRRMVAALFWLILGVTCALPAWAHTPALSVLAMKEVSPGVFVTSWEHTHGIDDVSAAYDLIRPVFPEHCRFEVPHVHCGTRGLTGRIGFDGLGALSASGMIKIAWADGSTRVLNVTTMQPHVRVTETRHGASTYRDAVTFVGTGVTHIWLGLDHLLFVFGLLWLVDSWRLLVKTITAFTIAHSIAFVAVEIAREARTRQPSFTRRSPWLVAFGFGLLHGLGFANALAELEVPTTKLPLALLGFNVGVEIGQLAFVAALVALRPAFRSLERTAGAPLRAPGYYAMGALAMYWFFERVVAFTPNLGQPA
jgi:hypothetical protein